MGQRNISSSTCWSNLLEQAVMDHMMEKVFGVHPDVSDFLRQTPSRIVFHAPFDDGHDLVLPESLLRQVGHDPGDQRRGAHELSLIHI